MSNRVWFAHGKVIENGFFCPFCDRMRTGRLIRDLYMWRANLSCGHVRGSLGLTMPYEELERKGYINQKGTPDPRYLAKVKQEWCAFFAKRREANNKEKYEDLFTAKSLIH